MIVAAIVWMCALSFATGLAIGRYRAWKSSQQTLEKVTKHYEVLLANSSSGLLLTSRDLEILRAAIERCRVPLEHLLAVSAPRQSNAAACTSAACDSNGITRTP